MEAPTHVRPNSFRKRNSPNDIHREACRKRPGSTRESQSSFAGR